MTKTFSRYKILGGFSLLALMTIIVSFGSYKLLTDSKISLDVVDLHNNENALLTYLFVLGLNVLFLILFMTQCKYLVLDKTGITTINPLIPFLRRRNLWKDFDYYITVDEVSRYQTHEAVWLIKNRRIKRRFSSFYYSNYHQLEFEVNVRFNGKQDIGPISQFLMLVGLKRIKN